MSGACWSPDGSTVLYGCGTVERAQNNGYPGQLRLWNWQKNETHDFATLDSGPVYTPVWSPDGTRIAAGSSNWRAHQEEGKPQTGTAFVFDAETGTTLLTVEHLSQIWAVAFSPDGKTLATGSGQVNIDKSAGVWGGGEVCLWNVQTGAKQQALARPNAHAQSQIAFSPDGTRVCTGDGPEGDVLVWETESGTLLHTLSSSHSGPVYAVAFSHDGAFLATGSKDGTVCLWETETGLSRQTFAGHETAVHSVAFAPDGKTLVSADTQKGVIKVWRL